MLRELRQLEQLGQRRNGLLRLQVTGHPAQVLVRRLGGLPRQAVHRQRLLHAGVGGDHRPARVGVATEIVDRVIERVCQLLQLFGRQRVGASSPALDEHRHNDGGGNQGSQPNGKRPDDAGIPVGLLLRD